jgi:hypothetical protein
MATELTSVLTGTYTLRVLDILTYRLVTVTAVPSCGHLQIIGRGRLAMVSGVIEENREILGNISRYSNFAVEDCRRPY